MKLPSANRALYVFLMFWLIGGPAYAATLTLHDPAQIREAEKVDRAIHNLSHKVMRCVARHGGKTDACVCRDACACKFKQDYRAVRAAFNLAIARYPGWAGNVIFYHRPNDPKGYNISFSRAMQRQFRTRCSKRR